jgi:hypothetical protein
MHVLSLTFFSHSSLMLSEAILAIRDNRISLRTYKIS